MCDVCSSNHTAIALSPTRRSRPSCRPPPEVSGRCCDSDCGMRRVHAMAAKLLFSRLRRRECGHPRPPCGVPRRMVHGLPRSEEHTSELQSRFDLVCRLLLEKKKKITYKKTRL